jgi:phosphotransferase system HPr (HPr) family protein
MTTKTHRLVGLISSFVDGARPLSAEAIRAKVPGYGGGRQAAERRLADVVSRAEVQEITLNLLLYWADRLIQTGRSIAEGLLPTYTNLQSLEVELGDGLTLHARPVSLIVAIVNHYGTPVEMEVQGQTCNASSILELMIAAGSHVEARMFTFRGDENPLRDIALLFDSGLGEAGIDKLPDPLSYLRND